MALRVALGTVASLMLAASVVGAVMSVRINWEFAQTLAPAVAAGWYLALTLATVETVRILMPFVRRGLQLAGMPHGWASAAFIIFTLVSIASAFGYFALNRTEAAARRDVQLSLSRGFKAELDSVARGLERTASARSIAEIDADIKPLTRNDPKRAELEKEKASAEQRERDRKRLSDLSNTHGWQTSIPSSKDAQTELMADVLSALPYVGRAEKVDIQRWVLVGIIVATILALELLVGVAPYAAIMVLVWACKRPEDTPGGDYLRDRPPKPNGNSPGFPETERKSLKRGAAFEDFRDLLVRKVRIDDQQMLAARWGVAEGTVSKWLPDFQRRANLDGLVVIRRTNGRHKGIVHVNGNGTGRVVA